MNESTEGKTAADRAFEDRADEWKKRLRGAMKERGLTQSDLARKINLKYFGTESGPHTQKNVSNWVNVGVADRKGHIRPFPKYETMAQIAGTLGLDVGYLTGEIKCTTYDMQKACDYTGLDEGALTKIRSLTQFEREFKASGDRESYGTIASGLLKAKSFPSLLDEMRGLSTLRDDRKKIMGSVEERFGTELAGKAFEYYDAFVSAGPQASKDEKMEAEAINESIFEEAGIAANDRAIFIEAVIAASRAIDDFIDEYIRLEQNENAGRYKIQKTFEEIVESMYPSHLDKEGA